MSGLLINPERLQWCLRHYCLTPEELAKRAGLRAATVRRASTGKQDLTVKQMRALTAALDLELFFLMEEESVSKDELRVPQFRAAGGQPPRSTEMMLLLARVEKHRGYFTDILADFPALKPRKVFYPKLPAGNDYAAKAKAVRRWLKLSGGADFAELRKKVEAKGVLVFVGSGGRRGRCRRRRTAGAEISSRASRSGTRSCPSSSWPRKKTSAASPSPCCTSSLT